MISDVEGKVAGEETSREQVLEMGGDFPREGTIEQRVAQSEGPALWLPRGRMLKAVGIADAKALWKLSAGCI